MLRPESRPTPRRSPRRAPVHASCAVLVGTVLVGTVLVGTLCLTMFGCRLQESPGPQATESPVVDVETEPADKGDSVTIFELQSRVMGFADGFAMGLHQPIAALSEVLPDENRSHLHRWQLTHVDAAVLLASGPNPTVSMLDLAGLTTLARMVMEDYWIPEVYGDPGRPLLEYHRHHEREIWKIVEDVLPDEEQKQLTELIQSWREAHLDQRFASFISVSDYSKERWQSPIVATGGSQSLFKLLRIDPLSSLDPAAREIAQVRYTVEHSLFYLKRMPTIVRLNMEMFALDLADQPQVARVIADIGALRETAAKFQQTVDELPETFVAEQEKFLDRVVEEKQQMGELIGELRSAFATGSEMATAVEKAIEALNAFVSSVRTSPEDSTQVEASQEATSPSSETKSFDVWDYGEAATRISAAASRLDAAIQSLDGLVGSPEWQARQQDVEQIVTRLEASADQITDRVFNRLLILVAVLLLGRFALLVIRRRMRRSP
jgi:phage shock protein A